MAKLDMQIEITDDAETAAWRAAKWFQEISAQAIAGRGWFRVALSGGSTPRRMLELLGNDPFVTTIDWDRTRLFWGDERCVPPDHPDSNFRMAREALLDNILIPQENVHRIKGELGAKAAAADYVEQLQAGFGIHQGECPRFDLILLGMGEDGHTASLFPGTEALSCKDAWVVANHVPQMNTNRVTFTFPLINHAENVVFVATGATKSFRLAEVLDHADNSDLPARRVRPESGRLIWIVDKAAALRLPAEAR